MPPEVLVDQLAPSFSSPCVVVPSCVILALMMEENVLSIHLLTFCAEVTSLPVSPLRPSTKPALKKTPKKGKQNPFCVLRKIPDDFFSKAAGTPENIYHPVAGADGLDACLLDDRQHPAPHPTATTSLGNLSSPGAGGE